VEEREGKIKEAAERAVNQKERINFFIKVLVYRAPR
jgi:hypothetical protein